jgi:colicin import membrane protein
LAKEKIETLERLKRDPEANKVKINRAEEDLKTLDYLYENYNIGMNVFRTAKVGRDKLRTE